MTNCPEKIRGQSSGEFCDLWRVSQAPAVRQDLDGLGGHFKGNGWWPL